MKRNVEQSRIPLLRTESHSCHRHYQPGRMRTRTYRSTAVLACVQASGEDPGPGGGRSSNQTLAHHLLDAGMQAKVACSAVDRDDHLRKLHLPLSEQELKHQLRFGVVRQAYELQGKRTAHSHLREPNAARRGYRRSIRPPWLCRCERPPGN